MGLASEHETKVEGDDNDTWLDCMDVYETVKGFTRCSCPIVRRI